MAHAHSQLFTAIGSGLLTFPVTHFNADYSFDEHRYREHIDWLLGYGPAVLFAAGGTGEFFSLGLDEFERVVKAAVSEARGRVPVIAGCGYGTSLAKEFARAAERAGAAAILLLPHYLVAAEQSGIEAHIAAVCTATSLGVIVYNRDNSILGPDALARLCDKHANLVGYKDGVGDIELLVRIRDRMGDRVFYVGGMPTHETYAAPYHAAGVSNYSSAIFNFLPRFAQGFYRAVQDGDDAVVRRGLHDFVLPYISIRGRRKGYAVSIVKAGLAGIGRPAGPVRPPLVDLRDEDVRDLRALLQSIEAQESAGTAARPSIGGDVEPLSAAGAHPA
jgi:5-dehydro-4-deoxyglucarate dehydratase